MSSALFEYNTKPTNTLQRQNGDNLDFKRMADISGSV